MTDFQIVIGELASQQAAVQEQNAATSDAKGEAARIRRQEASNFRASCSTPMRGFLGIMTTYVHELLSANNDFYIHSAVSDFRTTSKVYIVDGLDALRRAKRRHEIMKDHPQHKKHMENLERMRHGLIFTYRLLDEAEREPDSLKEVCMKALMLNPVIEQYKPYAVRSALEKTLTIASGPIEVLQHLSTAEGQTAEVPVESTFSHTQLFMAPGR